MNRLKGAAGSARKRSLAAAVVLGIVSGCGASGPAATPTPSPPPGPSMASAPSASLAARDIWSFEPLGPIEPGTYFIDPDLDPSTALRVVYEVPAQGWSMWVGSTKSSHAGHAGVSITTVVNLVTDGCKFVADPPVGPSVDDLTTALAALSPFQVTSPPSDVTIYGYDGKHLEWTVPDLPVTGEGDHQNSPDAPVASSRAGLRPSTQKSLEMRSTATPGLAMSKSSGSSMLKVPG